MLGLWGLIGFIFACFVDPYECVATIVEVDRWISYL